MESLKQNSSSRVARAAKHGVVFLAFILAMSGTIHAQEDARLGSPVRPIGLNLSAESARVCLGSFVPLELKMTNHSEREIKISKLDVWRNFSFEYVGADGSKESVGYLIWPGTTAEYERLQNEIRVLKPHDTYTTTFKFSVGNQRFFQTPNKYLLKAYYNQEAGSNAVSFETYDCNSK